MLTKQLNNQKLANVATDKVAIKSRALNVAEQNAVNQQANIIYEEGELDFNPEFKKNIAQEFLLFNYGECEKRDQ